MTAQLLPDLYQVWRDANGNPLVGGFIFSYAAGTTTPLATYTDFSAGTPNTNPIVLDAAGGANVWIGSSAYKFVVKDSLSNIIRTVDNVSYINADSIDKTKIASDIAGLALAQNGTGAIDVQVDDVTVEIVSNELQIKPGGIDADTFSASAKLEVIFKNVRDLNCSGVIQSIPQYEWSTPTILPNVDTLPNGAATVCKWSLNGEFLAVGSSASGYLLIYQQTGNEYVKLTDPATMPTGAVTDLAWSPCGDFLCVVFKTAPYVVLYQRIGNSFVVNPTPTISGSHTQLDLRVLFSPNSDFLTISESDFAGGFPVRNFKIYERGGTLTGTNTGTASVTIVVPDIGGGVGTAGTYTDAAPVVGTDVLIASGTTFTDITGASGVTGVYLSMGWSPDSFLFAAIDSVASPNAIVVYERRDTTFSSITPPDTSALTGGVLNFAFSPDGKFLAVISDTTPYLALYTVSNGLFTPISNPAVLPPGSPQYLAWSENGQYLAISHNVSPYIILYKVSGTTFTKQTNMATPANEPNGLDWSKTKQFLAVASSNTPYIQVYKTASTLTTNGLLWAREAPNV